MTHASDIIKKELAPEDHEFLTGWVSENRVALVQIAQYFCIFPGDVEVSFTIKMRKLSPRDFKIAFGDVTASREEIRKVMAEHEAQKMKASLAPE